MSLHRGCWGSSLLIGLHSKIFTFYMDKAIQENYMKSVYMCSKQEIVAKTEPLKMMIRSR